MQSFNDYMFFIYLPTKMLEILGLFIYRWKGLQNIFPTVYYIPIKFKITVAKQKTKICSRLVTADQGGQKNYNEKTIAVLFCNVFY